MRLLKGMAPAHISQILTENYQECETIIGALFHINKLTSFDRDGIKNLFARQRNSVNNGIDQIID